MGEDKAAKGVYVARCAENEEIMEGGSKSSGKVESDDDRKQSRFIGCRIGVLFGGGYMRKLNSFLELLKALFKISIICK